MVVRIISAGCMVLGVASGCAKKSTEAKQASGSSTAATPAAEDEKNPYRGLRSMVFEFRLAAGMPRLPDVPDVHGLVADWGLSERDTATITCMAEGSASLYLSSGGGVLGAGGHEAVRRACIAALQQASAIRSQLQPLSGTPLPAGGAMRFTLITDAGLRSAEAKVDDLMGGSHPLAPLGNAIQNVLTAIQATAPSE